jgi:hypothetical protein
MLAILKKCHAIYSAFRLLFIVSFFAGEKDITPSGQDRLYSNKLELNIF